MFARTSKLHDALVRADVAEMIAGQAKKQVRLLKTELQATELALQAEKNDYLHRLLHRHVIVHIKEPSMSMEGFLVSVYHDSVVVGNARVPIDPEGRFERLEGDQIVARSQIAWVQELTS